MDQLEKMVSPEDLEDLVSVDYPVYPVLKVPLVWLDSLVLKVIEALMEEMVLKVMQVQLA